jgi:hypothetical protein
LRLHFEGTQLDYVQDESVEGSWGELGEQVGEHSEAIVLEITAIFEGSKVIFRETLEYGISKPCAVLLKGRVLLCSIRSSKVIVLLEGLEAFNKKAFGGRLPIPCWKR